MATIVTRSGKGSALTHNEVDANFNNLNNDKIELTSGNLLLSGTITADGLTVDGSTTVDDILLTAVALPNSGNPSIALRNSDNNIYVQTGSGNTLSLLDSSQNTMYSVSPTLHSFLISNSEKMRIDASGNVLVGKTTLGISTNGFDVRTTGETGISVDSNIVLDLNRTTDDGKIINLRKDDTTVGSIGTTTNSYLWTGGTNSGIFFYNNGFGPSLGSSANGQLSDGGKDIGASGNRFKDLYLSGGVFLGGTGAANKLDDYEEGTFTPVFVNVSAPTYTDQTASYTKVGRLVHVSISITYSGLNTSDTSSLSVSLPFAATASGAFHLVESNTNTGFAGSNTISLVASVGAGATNAAFGSTGAYDDGDYDSGNWNASGVLRIAGIYPA